MSDNFSRYDEWNTAQAVACAAEGRLGEAARCHAAGTGAAPTVVHLQAVLILRNTANMLLGTLVAATFAAPDPVARLDAVPRPPLAIRA